MNNQLRIRNFIVKAMVILCLYIVMAVLEMVIVL